MVFVLKELPQFESLLAMSRRYPTLDPKAIECCLAFRKLAAELEAEMALLYAKSDLSHGRFSVLMMLEHDAGEARRMRMTPGELAGRSGVTPATMTGLLRGLERDGLISRDAHPDDRRAVSIGLTAAGQRHLAAMLPDYFRRIGGFVSHLSARDRDDLLRLLRKLSLGLPALNDPAPPPPPTPLPPLPESV